MRTIYYNDEDIKKCKLALVNQNLTSLQSAFLKQYINNLEYELQQKQDIINEITNYCKFQIEKEQDKLPDLLESEKWLKGRISAFVEVLDMECIRDINKYQKDQENNIDLLLNKLQQKEDIINKAKEYNNQIIKDTKEFYRPTSDLIYSGDCLIDLAEQNIKILDNKGDEK